MKYILCDIVNTYQPKVGDRVVLRTAEKPINFTWYYSFEENSYVWTGELEVVVTKVSSDCFVIDLSPSLKLTKAYGKDYIIRSSDNNCIKYTRGELKTTCKQCKGTI